MSLDFCFVIQIEDIRSEVLIYEKDVIKCHLVIAEIVHTAVNHPETEDFLGTVDTKTPSVGACCQRE